jgi:hypothetical protein
MTTEKRSASRVEARNEIEVINTSTGEPLGRLVNVSNAGFMLLGNSVIEPNQLFQLRLVFSEQVAGCGAVECGAESLWNNSASQASYHWTGFHIIDISDEHMTVLDEFIQKHG